MGARPRTEARLSGVVSFGMPSSSDAPPRFVDTSGRSPPRFGAVSFDPERPGPRFTAATPCRCGGSFLVLTSCLASPGRGPGFELRLGAAGRGLAWLGEARRGKARRGEDGLGKARQGFHQLRDHNAARPGKARRGKAGLGGARHGWARPGNARQVKVSR